MRSMRVSVLFAAIEVVRSVDAISTQPVGASNSLTNTGKSTPFSHWSKAAKSKAPYRELLGVPRYGGSA